MQEGTSPVGLGMKYGGVKAPYLDLEWGWLGKRGAG